jgi:hypothetical protein
MIQEKPTEGFGLLRGVEPMENGRQLSHDINEPADGFGGVGEVEEEDAGTFFFDGGGVVRAGDVDLAYREVVRQRGQPAMRRLRPAGSGTIRIGSIIHFGE